MSGCIRITSVDNETTEFLELFLRNLLLGENDPLQNRTMHISGRFKQDSGSTKQDSGTAERLFDSLISTGMSVRTANRVLTLMQQFGPVHPFGRTDAARALGITKSPASEIVRKLLAIDAIVPVTGFGKGKYQFNPAFLNRS